MSTKRMSSSRRAWLDARLSERDRSVLKWLGRLRLANGQQLEALCFGELNDRSRPVVRGRVLGRLLSWGLVEVVDRRVGGSAGGSTSAVYRLTSAGHATTTPAHPRSTRPYTDRFTAHTLATSQLAADLVDSIRDSSTTVPTFTTEPASWSPDGADNYLKPDAYIQIQTASITMHWWLETDLGTESLPALRRKLHSYLDFVERGQLGPHGLIPQVMITVVDDDRQRTLQRLINQLPDPAAQLFIPCLASRAVVTMLAALRE